MDAERTMKGSVHWLFWEITSTDHLSPSNAILASSAAGEYLTNGLTGKDFNSYAAHRVDHLTAQRATLANPKVFNEMVLENGGDKVHWRVEPEGQVMRM